MPIVTDNYTLSLTQDNRVLRVRCSQNDTSRQVNFTIYNNGTLFTIPPGLSVSVHGIKQNGNIFTKSCSYSGSVVTLVLGTQITDTVGISVAELVFTNSSGGKIGTSNFIFQVESDPLLRGTIDVTEETPTEYIHDLISMVEALSARVNNIITPDGEASLSEVVDARLSGYSGTTYQNLKARIDADFAALGNTKADKSDTYTKEEVDDAIDNVTITTDETLSVPGAAADAKKTGDAISEINGSLGAVSDVSFIGARELNYSEQQTGLGRQKFYTYPMTAGVTYYISIDVNYTSMNDGTNFFILSQYSGTTTSVAVVAQNMTKGALLYTPESNSDMLRIFAKGANESDYTAKIKIKEYTEDKDTIEDLIGAIVLSGKTIKCTGTGTVTSYTEFHGYDMTAGETYLIDISVDCNPTINNYFILSQYVGTTTAIAEIASNVKRKTMLYTPVADSNRLRIFVRCLNGTPYTVIVHIKKVTEKSVMTGGTYCSEGDSITAHNGWNVSNTTTTEGYTGFGSDTKIRGYQSYIGTKYDMTIVNNGVSGNSILESLESMLARDYSGYDLITIAYGVNDARENVPIGEIGGGTETTHNTTTFYGAYRTLLDKIYTDNPTARIVLMAPLQRHTITNFGVDTPNANGAYLKDFRDAVRNLADMYACKFWDGYGKSGYNQKNIYQLSYDGVHPNNEGYKVIANSLMDVIAEFDA